MGAQHTAIEYKSKKPTSNLRQHLYEFKKACALQTPTIQPNKTRKHTNRRKSFHQVKSLMQTPTTKQRNVPQVKQMATDTDDSRVHLIVMEALHMLVL